MDNIPINSSGKFKNARILKLNPGETSLDVIKRKIEGSFVDLVTLGKKTLYFRNLGASRCTATKSSEGIKSIEFVIRFDKTRDN